MSESLTSSFLTQFFGDSPSETKPVIVEYEHDERGTQYLVVKEVLETDGAFVLVSGGLVSTSAKDPNE